MSNKDISAALREVAAVLMSGDRYGHNDDVFCYNQDGLDVEATIGVIARRLVERADKLDDEALINMQGEL